jgi:hypothetical protein
MEKVFELLRLNEFMCKVKKWIKGKKNDDEDMFNHPFAIL